MELMPSALRPACHVSPPSAPVAPAAPASPPPAAPSPGVDRVEIAPEIARADPTASARRAASLGTDLQVALAAVPSPAPAAIRLILAGPPGAGKTTHGVRLAEALGIPHISTGNLLRDEVRKGSDLGKQAQPYLEKGDLVPLDITRGIVSQRLGQPDAAKGFILDGFPRRLEDVALLDDIRAEHQLPPVPLLLLDVPDEEILARVENRRVCEKGHAVDIAEHPPAHEGVCDTDGTPLTRRSDDDPAVVRHRLEIYREETFPVVKLFQERGLLHAVNASGPLDAVALRVMEAVQQMGTPPA